MVRDWLNVFTPVCYGDKGMVNVFTPVCYGGKGVIECIYTCMLW